MSTVVVSYTKAAETFDKNHYNTPQTITGKVDFKEYILSTSMNSRQHRPVVASGHRAETDILQL